MKKIKAYGWFMVMLVASLLFIFIWAYCASQGVEVGWIYKVFTFVSVLLAVLNYINGRKNANA